MYRLLCSVVASVLGGRAMDNPNNSLGDQEAMYSQKSGVGGVSKVTAYLRRKMVPPGNPGPAHRDFAGNPEASGSSNAGEAGRSAGNDPVLPSAVCVCSLGRHLCPLHSDMALVGPSKPCETVAEGLAREGLREEKYRGFWILWGPAYGRWCYIAAPPREMSTNRHRTVEFARTEIDQYWRLYG